MKKYLLYCLLVLYTFVCPVGNYSAYAQNLSTNLSNVNVGDLTDAQITQLLQRAQASGQTDSELIKSAKDRGMSESQISQLQTRISSLRNKNPVENEVQPRVISSTTATTDNLKPSSVLDTIVPKIFGSELFNGSGSTFEPNLRLATPLNYVLGPDDQLNISVYGNSVDEWKLAVTPEGTINIPRVGIINVNGKTVEQATAAIKSKLIASRFAIGNGTSLQVTLGNIRSIKVIITGEVNKPGTYTLPSLATVFNALYASGGPNTNGSFRNIEIIRENRIFRKLDIYDFLIRADQKDNIGLKDQDIIRVPSYTNRVEIIGEIKRPGIYEVKPGETLQDVINFSGKFTDLAYADQIQVVEIEDDRRSLADIPKSEFSTYIPKSGDKYVVNRILEKFKNRVTINGAVTRPGIYALEKGLTLSGLINKAAGLLPDAFIPRATITRTRFDNTTEIISFNVKSVLNDPTADIMVQKEDVIDISSIFDFRDQLTVNINGEVRKPGEFNYADNLTLENLIIKAGGFTQGASVNRVEVSRRVDNTNPNSLNGTVAKVFVVNVDSTMSLASTDFRLKPFDIVSVYTAPGFERQRTVKVEGEVFYPGFYTITTKNEKISDLLKKAGGVTPSAYIQGGTIKRGKDAILGYDKTKVDTGVLEQERKMRVAKIAQNANDTTTSANVQLINNFVGIDLKKIIEDPGSKTDLILEDGDVLRIPKQQQTVRVNGEVLFPSSIVYSSGKTFKSYVINAGGFSDNAKRRKSYILYANGTVKGTTKFLFFNSYPQVLPGSEIFIPKKQPSRGAFTQQAVAITSALATLGVLIIGIISLKK